nr:immunoglobulin light chain junction region [Macaca mulatta]MPN88796.1 immunoglobulin light chain junction region [Macaca mulatta]
CQQHNSYPTTF